MLRSDLSPADLPAAWNEKMRQYLGITPPDDARGCLQDIHWSGGAIGYFPTYTLGNLYAAQFFEQASAGTGRPATPISPAASSRRCWTGSAATSTARACRYRAPELVRRVTGKPLSAEPLLRHLRRKAAELYGV